MLDSDLLYPEQLGHIILLLLTPPALMMTLWHIAYVFKRRHSLWHTFGSLLINLLLGTSIAILVLMEVPHWQGHLAATDLRLFGIHITVWPFGVLCYAISSALAMGWLMLASKARVANTD